jgi:cell wall-associated NlpC family hydrolase
MNKIITSSLIVTLFMFAGCSFRPVEPQPLPIIYEEPVSLVNEKCLPGMSREASLCVDENGDSDASKKGPDWVSKALHKEYDKWCDTPYKYGGESLQGTDCSSLVRNVYEDAFGITLPRTSIEQSQVGFKIPQNAAKEGDLVFFKINSKTRHSGIIIGKGKFLHASTTEGVKISLLNDPYWKKKYIQTRRVLTE